VDHPGNLEKILHVLNRLAVDYNLPVIVSTHPRTRKRLENLTDFHPDQLIQFLKPFGFLDYVHLQQHARCTLSDSGTISEESSILSFPAISLRQSMERPEAQDAGTIILTGFEPQRVLDSVDLSIREHQLRKYEQIADGYMITDTSWRTLKLIMGNAGLSNLWHGIQ
jgi:UDP-N-acetylglucosamine 2-epimerase (non-hydrolysing)